MFLFKRFFYPSLFVFFSFLLSSCESGPPGYLQASQSGESQLFFAGLSETDFISSQSPEASRQVFLRRKRSERAAFAIRRLEELNSLIERKHDMRSFFGEAGLLGSFELSNDFVLNLASPALLKKFLREEKGFFKNMREIEGDDSLPHSEKISRLSGFFDDVEAFVEGGGFEEYARANINKELILRAIQQSSSEIMPGEGRQTGMEIYTIKAEGGELQISGGLSIQTPALSVMYGKQSYAERRFKEEMGYKKLIEDIGGKNAEAIGVNMYDNHQSFGVMLLADYIKSNQMDVYILGYCSLTCSNYLLPAAENIYIGQYGIILYGGETLSFMSGEIQELFDRAAGHIRKSFEEETKSAGGFFSYIYENVKMDAIRQFALLLKREGQTQFADKLQKILEALWPGGQSGKTGGKAKTKLSLADFEEAFGSLSQRETEAFLDFAFSAKENIQNLRTVFGHISSGGEREKEFFSKIKVSEDSAYMRLLNLSHSLTAYHPFFQSMFSVLDRQGFVGVPEEKKFRFVIPSTQVLRSIGLNIARGENSSENLYSRQGNRPAYMELGLGDIESCGFLSNDKSSWRPEDLKNCLKSPFYGIDGLY